MNLTDYFASKAHIKILEVLLRVKRDLCLRDLVELSGVSISSVQNALKYFEGTKTVRIKRVGQEKRFKIVKNKETEALKEIFLITEQCNSRKVKRHKNAKKVLIAIEEANQMIGALKVNGKKKDALHTD